MGVVKPLFNRRGLSIIEVLIAAGLMVVVLSATSTMMLNQYRETMSLSQRLAILDLEKFLILNSASGDICSRFATANPSLFTFPTGSFPPASPVNVDRLYLSSTSTQELARVGQPLAGPGSFVIGGIKLENFAGSSGNYIATLSVGFDGSVRPMKDIGISLKVATVISGANTVIIGCPGLSTGGTVPFANFVPFTNTMTPATFVVPPGVSALLVEAWGGGGGGGGSGFTIIPPTVNVGVACGGGGGGGGGYGKTVIPVAPGQTFTVVVGNGGFGGAGTGTASGIDALYRFA